VRTFTPPSSRPALYDRARPSVRIIEVLTGQ